MRRTGPRNGLRDGGRKAQKRCSVLPEPGSGGRRDDKRGGRQDTGVEREKRRRRRQASKTRAAAGKSGRPTGRRRKCRAKKKAAAGNLPPQGTLPRPVYWAIQMLTRFCSTPGKGWTVSPLPSAEMRSAAMPACSNAAATPAARCRESFRLRACEPVAASA